LFWTDWKIKTIPQIFYIILRCLRIQIIFRTYCFSFWILESTFVWSFDECMMTKLMKFPNKPPKPKNILQFRFWSDIVSFSTQQVGLNCNLSIYVCYYYLHSKSKVSEKVLVLFQKTGYETKNIFYVMNWIYQILSTYSVGITLATLLL
jgi:hypothetical protein